MVSAVGGHESGKSGDSVFRHEMPGCEPDVGVSLQAKRKRTSNDKTNLPALSGGVSDFLAFIRSIDPNFLK